MISLKAKASRYTKDKKAVRFTYVRDTLSHYDRQYMLPINIHKQSPGSFQVETLYLQNKFLIHITFGHGGLEIRTLQEA